MSPLLVILLGIVVLALKQGFELVLEKEYAAWAPALARLLIRAAGFVYWPRRGQWRADLRYVQQVEDESGLLPAGWCLLSAPWLVLRHVAVASCGICWRLWEEHVFFPRGLLVAGVIGTLIVGVGAGLVGPAHPVPMSIEAAAFSPNSKTIALASDDGTVELWDALTGEQIGQPLIGHTDIVTGVAFSPDGKTILTASANTIVRLWDVSKGKPIGEPLTGNTGYVYGVAFSPDAKMIASAGYNGTVRLWDGSTGKPIGQGLIGHTGPVWGVAFSPDGRTIASAGGDGTVRLWDASTGKPIGQALIGHTGPVWGVAFSPDGRTIASAGGDGTVRLWDASTGKPIGQPLIGHMGYVYAVAFSPDGKTIASAGADGTVRLWNPASGKQLSVLKEGVGLSSHDAPVAYAGVAISLLASMVAAQISRLRARLRKGQYAEA
jgi:hypothetical protein